MSRRFFYLFFCVCTFSAFVSLPAAAQTVTGIWRGYFISDDGSQYKLEFQVKQNNTGQFAVSGVSYSYASDKKFYGKATMTGNFMKSSLNFRIREIKTVEVKNLSGGVTCIMNYDLAYSKSGKEEFLEGTYLGKQETVGENNYEWGDCGGGKVFLRKVTSSDFYVEPFLREGATAKKKLVDPPAKTTTKPDETAVTRKTPPVTKPTQKPLTQAPVKKTGTGTGIKPGTGNPPAGDNNTVKKDPPAKKEPVTKTDSIEVKTPEITRKAPVKVPVSTPEVLRSRRNEVMKSLVVHSSKVQIKLYDNGEIDDDTISVYFDKRLVLSAKRLTAAPLTIDLELDDDGRDHELVMVAENLGRIPPNTSLMIVEAGDKRFTVQITSTEQKNAVVRLRYELP